MEPLPPQLEAEREALLHEIEAAFDGVTREGSPSWSEAEGNVPDGWARTRDLEGRWQELPDNPVWAQEVYPAAGAWAFLDARAYRYYLPAGMTVCLRACDGNDFDHLLNLCRTSATERKEDDASMQAYHLDQWALLDVSQRRCVDRFLIAMERIEHWVGRDEPDIEERLEGWRAAQESQWSRYAENP